MAFAATSVEVTRRKQDLAQGKIDLLYSPKDRISTPCMALPPEGTFKLDLDGQALYSCIDYSRDMGQLEKGEAGQAWASQHKVDALVPFHCCV